MLTSGIRSALRAALFGHTERQHALDHDSAAAFVDAATQSSQTAPAALVDAVVAAPGNASGAASSTRSSFSMWWPLAGSVLLLAGLGIGAMVLQQHQTTPAFGPIVYQAAVPAANPAPGTPAPPALETATDDPAPVIINKLPDCPPRIAADGSRRVPPSGPCIKAQKPRILPARDSATTPSIDIEGRPKLAPAETPEPAPGAR